MPQTSETRNDEIEQEIGETLLRVAVERRLTTVLERPDPITAAERNEMDWLRKVLAAYPETDLKKLAKQTRFLIERESQARTKAALQTLTKDYCVTCGAYVGKHAAGPCKCAKGAD